MITKNYNTAEAGTLVASGAGVATVSSDWDFDWAIGSSAVTAPTVQMKHVAKDTVSLSLGTGEYLWIFGANRVAVTAENAAAGEI